MWVKIKLRLLPGESQEENILKQSWPEALPSTTLRSDLSQAQESTDQVPFFAQNLPLDAHKLLNKILNL